MKRHLQKKVEVSSLRSKCLILCIAQILASPLWAEELVNISDISGCRVIKNENERLACYDIVSGGGVFNEEKLREVEIEEFGSKTMRKAPAEPVAVTPTPEPVTEAAPAAVAAEQAPPPVESKSVSKKRLTVTIVRSKKDGNGFHHFQTADGQVWKQLNANSWTLNAPYEAVIKKGLLGSFFLVSEGGKSTRIKRLK